MKLTQILSEKFKNVHLKIQQKNGAYIAEETETHYKTRIKIR